MPLELRKLGGQPRIALTTLLTFYRNRAMFEYRVLRYCHSLDSQLNKSTSDTRSQYESVVIDRMQMPRNPRRQMLLPMLLETRSAGLVTRRYLDAVPDTGADENAIDWTTCKSLGFDLDRRPAACKKFTTANGRPFWSIGQTEASCSFARGKDKTQSRVRSNVFSDLAAPLILGQDFLEETRTLNLHKNRLIEKLDYDAPTMRVLHMTRPSRRLQCSVDGLDAFAHADTGADMNLVSPHFASKIHRTRSRLAKEDLQVQFADGSTEFISASFEASLSMDGRQDTSNVMTKFYVLPGLTSDVLLGNAVLEEANVFMNHLDSFTNIFNDNEQLSLNIIKWLTERETRLVNVFKQKRPSPRDSGTASSAIPDARLGQTELRSALAEADARELYRREQAEIRISKLTAHERGAADDRERARAAEYDSRRVRCVILHEQRLAAQST